MSTYEDYTINSKNPLARYAHRTRLRIATQMVAQHSTQSLLDYGCGDGTFIETFKSAKIECDVVGFEPYMEAKSGKLLIHIYQKWQEVINHAEDNKLFDTVVCFEVMEHFSEVRQKEHLMNIKSILSEDATIIISVPIEKGLGSFVKNLRRVAISYKGNEAVYSLKNILCSILGIKTKEMIEIRNKIDYLPHMGFYFNEFEALLRELFVIECVMLSPFPYFSSHINSQVFYKLRAKKS
jgi:2-polyprenyl-3-methyl-5-hydroxy-6-metoxy-1,4-benzoquinol methylase